MSAVELVLDEFNKLKISLFGATIISWIEDGEEVLFLSKKSLFDNKKAIRGGIPLVFPNFGAWEGGRPQHGFARVKTWQVKDMKQANDLASITLSLTDDEDTRKIWPYSFELLYEVTLSKTKLKTNLTVKNTGTDEFDFTCLLHTYFKVDDIAKVFVSGFGGCEYSDKVKNGSVSKEANDIIHISGETDRVYASTPQEHILTLNDHSKRRVSIQKFDFPDTVVWNPWNEKAKSMSDFGDDEYVRMICVEAGAVQTRQVLRSSETATFGQEITILWPLI